MVLTSFGKLVSFGIILDNSSTLIVFNKSLLDDTIEPIKLVTFSNDSIILSTFSIDMVFEVDNSSAKVKKLFDTTYISFNVPIVSFESFPICVNDFVLNNFSKSGLYFTILFTSLIVA